MKLNVNIDNRMYQIEVPQDMLLGAISIFQKIDKDLDAGWQMSREWVKNLDTLQRCQVIANRLLTAIENHNEPSMMMMAGYIVHKMPAVKTVHIDTEGDMSQTEFEAG